MRLTHSLLINKLLSDPSPFTLILDSLEESGKPLVAEIVRRAKIAKTNVIFVSFETIGSRSNVIQVHAHEKPHQWQSEALQLVREMTGRTLLMFDTLNPLCNKAETVDLSSLLSSFISPTVSVVAVYHMDIPRQRIQMDPYAPAPIILLKYFATTTFTMHSLHHVLEKKRARERSLVEPSYGLEAEIEGVVQALGANGPKGSVFEMEHRRKSGRAVREWYFLPPRRREDAASSNRSREPVILLEDHPEYAKPTIAGDKADAAAPEENSTFDLGLTEKQRSDREGIVLPYFDAQKGGGEGGRILYDMGSEDDFDEEEDEI